ncbi:unnamed protein product [Adineta steineri]|uniref:Uncharacterized protein n=2 Tax=Adineta steineri TaxID=433720 RepID=A0A814GBN4_9BILA|nr:unnamed protein product [Adineta steineri]
MNEQLVTVQLLSEDQVRSQILANIDLIKSSIPAQIESIVKLLQITTQSNSLTSALNTNTHVKTDFTYAQIPFIAPYSTHFYDENKTNALNFWAQTCNIVSGTAFAGFYSLSPLDSINNHLQWPLYYPYLPNKIIPNATVDGFFSGCTPLDGLLVSTLDCLYSSTCLKNFADYFPDLNQTNSTWLNGLSASFQKRIPVKDLLSELFVEEWSPMINYPQYFTSCAPKRCTYTEINHMNLFYTAALLLALYGGLTILLRLITSFSISVFFKLKRRSTNNNLNRAYKQLQETHSDSLECSCSNIAVPFEKFVTWLPRLHQLCSSDFITENWITLLSLSQSDFVGWYEMDWFGFGGTHFRFLSTLCQLANKTVTDAIQRFDIQSFITLNVTTETSFNIQLHIIVNDFAQSFITNFDLLIQTVQLLTQTDQPYKLNGNALLFYLTTQAEISGAQYDRIGFQFTGPTNAETNSVSCICATDPHCQIPVFDPVNTTTLSDAHQFSEVTGSMQSCYVVDSVLVSTLECYYSHSCVSILYKYINKSMSIFDTGISYFDVNILVNDSALTRFPPNTSLSTIVKALLVEEWNPVFSFDQYYEQCAPSKCTYSQELRTTDFLGIIIFVISIIGGLIAGVRLIASLLIKMIAVLWKIKRRPKVAQQPTSSISFSRIKQNIFKLIKLLPTILSNLNIFPRRTFGGHFHDDKAKYFGQLSTRLYIILLIITMIVLAFYNVIQSRTIIKTFDKPDIDIYNSLLLTHSDTLQCRCSSISSTYNHFVQIQPVFHQICLSPFISEQWRTMITSKLYPDLSIYHDRDYRRFLSSHLQLLSGLCSEAMQSVNSSINQLLSSFFLTDQLVSLTTLENRINSLVNSSQSNAPNSFVSRLSLIRSINYGNAIMSAYGTNFQYIVPWGNPPYPAAITQALIYDDECSCALNMNCTTQAGFILDDLSTIKPINGLKIGCTPSEALFSSTLECFYNISCINLILEFVDNDNMLYSPLSSNNSRFSMNSTVLDLIINVFIEDWLTSIDYLKYFNQCLPSSCSYQYIQRFNWLYTVTVLLGLYGGLSFIFKWLCPKIILLFNQIYQYYRKRRNTIGPISSTTVATITNTTSTLNENHINNTTTDACTTSSILPPKQFTSRMYCYIILGMILFGSLLVAMIVVSIYLNWRANMNHTTSTVLSTTVRTTDSTTSTTPILSTEPSCALTFDQSILFTFYLNSSFLSIITDDFNGDTYLDLALVDYELGNLIIFVGNNNGTFTAPAIYVIGSDNYAHFVAAGDLNNDNYIDLAVANINSDTIGIFFGYGNGTFQTQQIISTGFVHSPSRLVIGDFNDDHHLDIVVKGMQLGIMFGLGNGYLDSATVLCDDNVSNGDLIITTDFNNDTHLDLIVSYYNDNMIRILLNNGDGYFYLWMTLTLEKFSAIDSFTIADLNNDNRPDLVIANSAKNYIVIFIQNNNGSFGQQTTYSTGVYGSIGTVLVGDFNNDGQVDLAATFILRQQVNIWVGIGNGTFLVSSMFPTGSISRPNTMITGDYNSDNKLDFIVLDMYSANVLISINTCDCCIQNISKK